MAYLLHPNDRELFEQATNLAYQAAKYLNVRLDAVEPKKRPFADVSTGRCYCNEYLIRITLRFKDRKSDGGKWWKNPLDTKEIMETVLHEVAHLKHTGHGKEFKKTEQDLLNHFQNALKENYNEI